MYRDSEPPSIFSQPDGAAEAHQSSPPAQADEDRMARKSWNPFVALGTLLNLSETESVRPLADELEDG